MPLSAPAELIHRRKAARIRREESRRPMSCRRLRPRSFLTRCSLRTPSGVIQNAKPRRPTRHLTQQMTRRRHGAVRWQLARDALRNPVHVRSSESNLHPPGTAPGVQSDFGSLCCGRVTLSHSTLPTAPSFNLTSSLLSPCLTLPLTRSTPPAKLDSRTISISPSSSLLQRYNTSKYLSCSRCLPLSLQGHANGSVEAA